MVDSCDKERLGIAKEELFAMLEEEELKNAILCVFANKQDMPGMSPLLPLLSSLATQFFKT